VCGASSSGWASAARCSTYVHANCEGLCTRVTHQRTRHRLNRRMKITLSIVLMTPRLLPTLEYQCVAVSLLQFFVLENI
jgi:hypothetical protein